MQAFNLNIELKILNKEFYKDRDLPTYATEGSVAMDLVCTEDILITGGEIKTVPTGLAIHIGSDSTIHDQSVAALIMPRSGLGKHGLILSNTIGVIDEDYQGELLVSVWNRCVEHVDGWGMSRLQNIRLKEGDRFAQLMFVPIVRPRFKVVSEFSKKTDRSQGCFGSTGL